MTQEEIVLETIEHYRTHPRSLKLRSDCSVVECVYEGPNGERCAFSRCCTEDSVFHEGRYCAHQPGASLKYKYHGHPWDFWIFIQELHDRSGNWQLNDQGGADLTQQGRDFVAVSLAKWV